MCTSAQFTGDPVLRASHIVLVFTPVLILLSGRNCCRACTAIIDDSLFKLALINGYLSVSNE